MARSIWTGVISFGLVSIPVGLYPATEEHEVEFHQFQEGTSDRIRYKRVNERTGDEVPYDKIVKGADLGDGATVQLRQEELDAVAPGRSRSLDVQAFVALSEIDPLYFQRTYWLGPGSDASASTYALLRDAMAHSGRVAIATFVMRSKQYLAAIRADGDVLALETMFFADEVRDPHDTIADLPGKVRVPTTQRRLAEQLIETMSDSWRPEDYLDTYADRLQQLIDAKRAGGDVTLADAAPAGTEVVDLMTALRASVERAQGGQRTRVGTDDDDLRSRTVKELRRLAGEHDVPGRSAMTKDELLAALEATPRRAS